MLMFDEGFGVELDGSKDYFIPFWFTQDWYYPSWVGLDLSPMCRLRCED